MLRRLLDSAGVAYEIDTTLVRGLDYYTRTVFEFTSDELAAGQSTVGAGGRYDGLVELLGGPPTPGAGWAAGVERIILASPAEAEPPPAPDLYVAHDGSRPAAFNLALDARAAGLRAQLELAGRSLKGQFKHAERLNARFVAVVDDETVTLRDRSAGSERVVAHGDVVAAVKQALEA